MTDTTSEIVRFRFRPTIRDVTAPSLALGKRSRAAKWWALFWLGVLAIPMGIGTIWPKRAWSLVAGLVVLGAMVSVRVHFFWKARRIVSRSAGVDVEYEFSADGFRCGNGSGEAIHFPWADLSAVTELESGYVIARADGVGCALPRRAILDDRSDDVFRHLVRTYAPDRGASLARVLER